MQKRRASSFENRDPRSQSSRQRSLRRVGAVALLLCAWGMSAGGCSRQGEGERCDHAANGDEDCDDGLECVRPRGSVVDRCCPPAGAAIDDARCNGSDAPAETGGTAGAAGSGPGGADSGGASNGGMSTTGGADEGDGGSGADEGDGGSGADEGDGGSGTGEGDGGVAGQSAGAAGAGTSAGGSTGGVSEPAGGGGGVPAASGGTDSAEAGNTSTGGTG